MYRYEQEKKILLLFWLVGGTGCDLVFFSTPATPTLKELSNEVDSVVDWFSLGVKLELERHVLSQLDKEYRGDNVRCKYEMLDRWLRNAKQPTWKAMADALCLIGEHTVALNIRTKYCPSELGRSCGKPVRISQGFLSSLLKFIEQC